MDNEFEYVDKITLCRYCTKNILELGHGAIECEHIGKTEVIRVDRGWLSFANEICGPFERKRESESEAWYD